MTYRWPEREQHIRPTVVFSRLSSFHDTSFSRGPDLLAPNFALAAQRRIRTRPAFCPVRGRVSARSAGESRCSSSSYSSYSSPSIPSITDVQKSSHTLEHLVRPRVCCHGVTR